MLLVRIIFLWMVDGTVCQSTDGGGVSTNIFTHTYIHKHIKPRWIKIESIDLSKKSQRGLTDLAVYKESEWANWLCNSVYPIESPLLSLFLSLSIIEYWMKNFITVSIVASLDGTDQYNQSSSRVPRMALRTHPLVTEITCLLGASLWCITGLLCLPEHHINAVQCCSMSMFECHIEKTLFGLQCTAITYYNGAT